MNTSLYLAMQQNTVLSNYYCKEIFMGAMYKQHNTTTTTTITTTTTALMVIFQVNLGQPDLLSVSSSKCTRTVLLWDKW